MEKKCNGSNELKKKLQQIKNMLLQLAPAAIAYSGGVDSALLLKIALDVLPQDQVTAIMAIGPMVPKSEADFAADFAKQMGCETVTFSAEVLAVPGFVENGPKRCYFCKKYLFGNILALAEKNGCKSLLDGTNADDVHDYRPGRLALEELGIKSPFLEVGMTKEEIRELSRLYGLPTAQKPAMACLATRIPTGTAITDAALKKVEAGEEILKSYGLHQYRLRILGNTGRIECMKEEMDIIRADWDGLTEKLGGLGFAHIELSQSGYVCGSMNRYQL